MTVAAFLQRLAAVTKTGDGWRARCPAHEDRTPSLAVREGRNRNVLVKCHAGCSIEAIAAAAHVPIASLFGDELLPPRPPGPRAIERRYQYQDEQGTLLFEVCRMRPKAFRQRSPAAGGGWSWTLNGVRRVVYRLPRVLKAAAAGETVYIAEGEKDVEALEQLGLVATCNAGGAGKWRAEYSKALRGAGGAVVLPDNDDPGRRHALDVARSLHAMGIPVKVLELPGLAAHGDVSDWIAADGTREQLLELVRQASAWQASPRPGPEDLAGEPVLVTVASVKPERVEWLWMHRIPLGKLTVLDGDPGLGKSTLTLDLAARVSTGRRMPGDDREPTNAAGVVLLTAEDGIADTVRPRLEAAGAALDRIAVLTAVRDAEGLPQLPVFPDHAEAVRRALKAVGAALLVVDPLMAFLSGSVDSHRDQDVRGALRLLAELGEQARAAVVIVRHLNKAGGGHPIYRGGGSIGIIGAARAGLLVANDPKDERRRIVAASKSNLGPVAPSLAYRIVPTDDVSRVEWEGVAEGCSARELLEAQRDDGEESGRRSEAASFLRELLADGPVHALDVLRQAKQAGIAEKTLRRAADALGVERRKGGMAAGWSWSLPGESEDRQGPPKMPTLLEWPPSPPSAPDGHLRTDETTAGEPARPRARFEV